jgi:hypothetical protein
MKDLKKPITFRMKTEHIQWIKTCAEIEDRKIISVVEEAIEAFFSWRNVPDYPKKLTAV